MTSGIFFTDYSFSYPNENVLVATSSLEQVPTKKLPLINFTMNGIIKPSDKVYEIKIIFPKDSVTPEKDALAGAYGTFTIGNKVYNARNIVKPAYDKEKKVLTIILDMRNTCYKNIKRVKRFSFSVQMNDCAWCTCTTTCTKSCTSKTFCPVLTESGGCGNNIDVCKCRDVGFFVSACVTV